MQVCKGGGVGLQRSACPAAHPYSSPQLSRPRKPHWWCMGLFKNWPGWRVLAHPACPTCTSRHRALLRMEPLYLTPCTQPHLQAPAASTLPLPLPVF